MRVDDLSVRGVEAMTSMIAAVAVTGYYIIGLVWLTSGLFHGWLKAEGHPMVIASWIAFIGAPMWLWLYGKILWDLSHGRPTTNFLEWP